MEIYQEWSPQFEEEIVLIDLESEFAFSGVVSHIANQLLQAQNKNSFYTVSLPLDLKDYQSAKVIIPLEYYPEFQELFELKPTEPEIKQKPITNNHRCLKR